MPFPPPKVLVMIDQEIWKDVKGYEGLYLVSNFGRVKRLPLGKQYPGRQTHNNIRKPIIKNGYYVVNLSKNNIVKYFLVHRLVAMAFLPNPDNLPCINHKDETRTNNRVENLEWCSYRYNANYGTGTLRQRISRAENPNNIAIRKLVGEKNSKAVRQYTPNGEFVAEYKSMTEASQKTGIHITSIVRHCKGRIGNTIGRKVRKYIFRYA